MSDPPRVSVRVSTTKSAAAAGPPLPKKPPPPAVPAQPARGAVQNQAAAAFAMQQQKQQNALLHKQMQIANAQRSQQPAQPVAAQTPGFTPQQVAQFAQQLPQLQQQQFAMLAPQQKAVYIQHQVRIQQLMQQLPQMTQQQQQQLYQQLTPQQQQQLAQLPPQQQQHHLVQFQKNLLVKQQQMLFAQLAQQAQAAAGAGAAVGAVPQPGPTPLPQMPTPLPQMPQATTPAAQPAPLPTLPVQAARPLGGVSVLPVMQATAPEAEEPVAVTPVITPQSFAQPLPVPQAATASTTLQKPIVPASTPSTGSLPPPSLPRKPPVVPSRPPAPGDRPEPPKPARSSSEKVVELSWPKEGNIFEKPDDPSQIIYETAEKSAKPKIKAATVEKLIEKATNPTSEPMMQKSFLLTYRSMDLTPYALMDLLVQRYSMPLPEGNEASLSVFKSKHQLPVQIRVCQLLKTWVQKHFYDFENDTKLQQMFLDFVVNTIKPQHSIGKQLEEIMHRQINGESTVIQITELPPKPILPKMKVNIQFTDIHPIELARQLTIIEWNIYKSIIPSECTGLAWSKKNAAERAPNVLAMIDRFNVVSNWVVSEILKPETQKQRVEVLGHFIEIAERCKGLNNFNGCMEIISGLGDASIHRLKSHWAELPKKASTIYTDLKAVLSSDQSYKSLRAYLKTCDGSCIPYLGMYLTDLTFIEDGNNDKISDLHNFSKRMFVANVIQEIQYYQQAPYVLEPVPAIQNFLATLAGKIMDKETCYQRSLQIIPRGGGAATPATGGGGGGAGGASTPVVARRGTEAAGEEDYGEMEQLPGYKFLEKDSNKNIRVQTNTQDTSSGGIKVVAGTLEKIVERVTYRTFPDPQFVEAFLLTYRSYTSGKQLLELLMMRFNMPVPKNPAVMERFKNEQQRPVQLRVINVLKNWTEKYFIDFVNERALLPMLTSFAENNQSHAGPLKQMIKKLRQKIQTYKSSDSKKPVLPATQSGAPAMHQQLSGSDRAPKVADFHPEEVVRQICLYDFALLSMIHPLEMTNKTYQVDQRRAIHLLRFQRRQSAISNWVVNTLIQQANERRANLTLMIQMALSAYELRNFHLLAALKHGLSSSEVKSLSQTWESVDSKIIEKYEQLLTNVNVGLASLKAFQTKFVSNESLEEPGIPVLDLYLTELSNIEEKQNNLVDESLINILKARQMSTVVSDFLRFRNVPYNFEHHSWLQHYIQVDIDKFGDRDSFDDSSLSEQLSSMHPDKVKLAIKTQINEDPKLRNEMCMVLKKLLQEQLVNNEMQKLTNQVQTYKEQVNKEIELVHQKFNPPGLNTLMDKILTTRFQDAEFNDWSFEDKDGNVYGWPENITVDTLTTGSGENYLYFLKSAFDKAELALIMRIAAFYEQFSGCDSPPKTLVFSSFIAANTRSVAQQSGIELISVI